MNLPLWFSNFLYWSAQVALLTAVAAMLPRLFQIRQPRVLLIYWRSLIALTLLLPFSQPWHRPASTPVIAPSVNFPATTVAPLSPPAVSHWPLPSPQTAADILALVILLGVVIRLAFLALGLLKLRQLSRDSLPVSAHLDTAALLEYWRARVNAHADFRLSAHGHSPVTFGFFRPIIFLPEKFPSLDTRFQAAIACHELLHVRRRDWLHHLAEELVRSLFWFHPAIAWLISRVRLAREQVVDFEVVRITEARKSYLEALLEFTEGRAAIAAIPAPLFLAERQLVERVSLMLKEVRMSRKRLIVSLAASSCCVAAAVALAAWIFPLRASPLLAQSTPQTGVPGGVAGGVSGGVSRGVAGGINGGVSDVISSEPSNLPQANEPAVDYSTIWIDTVKRGPMLRQLRGFGQLVHGGNSSDLIARVTVPEVFASDLRPDESATIQVRPNQNVSVDATHPAVIKGRVTHVGPTPSAGTQTVDMSLDASRPSGLAAGLQIEAAITIEQLENVLHVGRPANIPANSPDPVSASVFKIVSDGKEAQRVVVKFGRSSASAVEVLDGLKEGDKIILSDTSSLDKDYRIYLTDQMHPSSH